MTIPAGGSAGAQIGPGDRGSRFEDILSPLSIARQSIKLSGANVAGALLMVPVLLFVARVLGPTLMGVVGLVTLWQLYANLLKPSMFGAAFRELPGSIAAGNSEAATRLQNLGITSEATYLVLPVLGFVAGALIQSDALVRNALLVGSVAFVFTQVNYFLASVQWAHQRYGLIARANFASSLVAAAFVLVSIRYLGVYSALLIPGVTAMTAIVTYRLGAPPIGFRAVWSWSGARKLLRVGIPLALGTIFYWAFRTTDRTMVAALMPLAALGYLSFSMQFIDAGIKLVGDFQNVLAMRVWSRLRTGTQEPLGTPARSLTLTILVVTCMAINLAQAGFGAVIKVAAPSFAPAVPVLEILAILLTAGTAGILPVTILNSPAVNRQKLASAIYGVGVPINALLVFASIRLGYGLVGVAASSVVAQSLVAAWLLFAVRDEMFEAGEPQFPFYLILVGIYALSIGIDFLFHIEPLRLGTGNHIFVAAGLRTAIALAVWVPVFIVFAHLRWPSVATGKIKVPVTVN